MALARQAARGPTPARSSGIWRASSSCGCCERFTRPHRLAANNASRLLRPPTPGVDEG